MMLGNVWEKISALILRRTADKLDPPTELAIATATAAEMDALNGVSELQGITGACMCGDGDARMYSGHGGSFAIEKTLDKSLRDKGFLSSMGQITITGFKALEMSS